MGKHINRGVGGSVVKTPWSSMGEHKKIGILNQYSINTDRDLIGELRTEIQRSGIHKIVVLDDDPTGTQTVAGVPVYTGWDEESMKDIFGNEYLVNFILTNSRAFSVDKTIEVHREIALNIEKAAKKAAKKYLLVSRSDSTLRGHYPTETEVLRREIEKVNNVCFDGEIICPYFAEGGRYTIDHVHYVKDGTELIPAAETEFAQDATFGYHESDLKKYIQEKTKGRFKEQEIIDISLEELNDVRIDEIIHKLEAVEHFNKIIVNAVNDEQLIVFCIALYRTIHQGKNFLFRTAASFVRALAGMTQKAYLDHYKRETKGVIVVGSHTDKTTRQIQKACELDGVIPVLLEVNGKDGIELAKESTKISELCSRLMEQNKIPLVYTSREVIKSETKEKALERSVQISDAVQSIVANLQISPDFVIAKGGITSSDVATKALNVKKADVVGQAAPGLPVWRLDSQSRFPNILYIIFPGNVGEENTLKQIIQNICETGGNS